MVTTASEDVKEKLAGKRLASNELSLTNNPSTCVE